MDLTSNPISFCIIKSLYSNNRPTPPLALVSLWLHWCNGLRLPVAQSFQLSWKKLAVVMHPCVSGLSWPLIIRVAGMNQNNQKGFLLPRQQAKWVSLTIYEIPSLLWAAEGRHRAQLDRCRVFGKSRVAVLLRTQIKGWSHRSVGWKRHFKSPQCSTSTNTHQVRVCRFVLPSPCCRPLSAHAQSKFILHFLPDPPDQ